MKYRKGRGKAKELDQELKMGGSRERSQWNGFCPNGLKVEEAASVTRPLDPGRRARAEKRTAELISRIQPNRPSEKHRNAIASYVRRLVSNCVPCEVFTFGSVPLKTYLPDGDIDLTAFSEDEKVKDIWATEVRNMLQKEEKNEHAEFPVKEVQYRQAEVPIIKFLVDNIVVDLSFNQLGGLCTLCFLEEVDNLINHDHLFKRSIILIKAWCYYESRILGANHGLISTYALETLVLYIFHVYNNSFSGPLEVLYRFLEFFSKFDWANFCVSLWGPVPVNSLPSMAADPPRKDGSELLLNKMFLNACGTAYSVFRAGQDNPEQRFIAKYLNVVDPLRLDNNLGRSVSKGNFYRIRSAFSLGAQQLARILECPMEDIVPELNQFFANTWDRHGKGCRPDVPILDVSYSRQGGAPRELIITELAAEKFHYENTHPAVGYSVQPSNFPLRQTTRITDARKDLRSPKLKDRDESRSQIVSGSDHFTVERSNLWKKQHDDIRRTCRMNVLQTRGLSTHHFARTCSSPELTSMHSEAASICKNIESTENGDDDANSRSGFSRSVRNSRISENRATNYFADGPSIRESTSRHSPASDSDQSSGSSLSKSLSSANKPVVSSVHELSQRRLKEQNFMNKLSSSGIQNFGGHAQMPVNLASHSFVHFPPATGYSYQDYPGNVPTKTSAVESDWATAMQYSNGPFFTPFNQHFRPVTSTPEPEGTIGGLNEMALPPEAAHVDENGVLWTDRNTHSVRENDHESEDLTTGSSRLSPASPATSSRTKASSVNSWDGKTSKVNDQSRHPVWKKTVSRNSSAIVNSRWEEDGKPVDHRHDTANDDVKDWVHLPTTESVAPAVTNSDMNQIPAFGPPHNSMSPFSPLLVHPGSSQGVAHNHAVLPVAFYPPGASVPFVTMVPVFNMPAESGTNAAHVGGNHMEKEKPTYHMDQSGYGPDPANEQEPTNHTVNSDSVNVIPEGEYSDECGSDIFNSDFPSHWKNLQYGRLCQSPQRHPFVYPPSVLVPPVSLQATSSVVSPGRPNSLVHAVPISAPQSGSVKPPGVPIQYGGEVSKQRNGTGTYFPNPDFIKERQCSTPRQYRGDYVHDRNENLGDNANWNSNSKPRFSGRAQPRIYQEKPNTKKDRSATSISQTDRPWDTLQQNSNQFYCLSKCPSPSKPTQYVPDVVDYSVYQVHSTHSDEVSSCGDALPRLVMLYPHSHPVGFGSWAEHLQFGSVRPEHLVGAEVQEFGGYRDGGVSELQNYQGDTGPPSPD